MNNIHVQKHQHQLHDLCGCGYHDHEHHDHQHHDGSESHDHAPHAFGTAETAGAAEKTYIIEGLDCANCAAKIERKIQDLPEIKSASLTFATKQLRIAAADPDGLLPRLEKMCLSVEDGVSLRPKERTRTRAGNPGADRRAGETAGGTTALAIAPKKSFFRQNAADLLSIIAGAALFAAGLIAKHLQAQAGLVLAACLLAYIILGWRVLWTAVKNITRGQVFDENFLMSIATVAAFCIGDFAEGAGVMLFYRVGEFFEHVAVEKSRTQIMDAVDMRPETVNLIDGDQVRVIPAEDAAVDDVLAVRPGDRIPLDGVVVEGESRIDTSPVTGEPVPVRAAPGTEVVSGCVNQQGLLHIQVQKPLAQSMVTRILDSVENAAAGKPRIDKFITRFAKVYTPIVVALALLTAIVPSLVTGQWSFWITTAITFLVISCPCALVISVPLAFFSGIGAASRLGILFKGGLSIEALKKVKAVIMDKTGTITRGNFAVQQVSPEEGFTEARLLAIAAACEASSTHPIAASILEAAREKHLVLPKAARLTELSGRGIKAVLEKGAEETEALCGNRTLLTQEGILPEGDHAKGTTEVLVALNGRFAGSISISDTLKEDASAAVASMKRNGLVPAMLTGDGAASAKAVADQVGIEKVSAGLLPEEKLTALQSLRAELGPVLFVGDGINDAPVLAGADVGAAMGSGADAAIEAADVVFMNPSVAAIPQSIGIARATGTIAAQNVILALAIKLLVILLGLVGFANIWAAVFADTGVAMLCILNSLRILWRKF